MSTSINIKKQIAAYEEGSQISSDISGIDVTGNGASASMVGSKMVIDVPGGIGNITYYLNQTVTQAPYKEFSSISTGAAEQTISNTVAGSTTITVQSFQTASGVPGTTNIPGGLWSFYLHFSGTSGDNWDVYVEVYKRNLGGIETLLLTTDTIAVSTLSGTPTMILTDGVFPTSTVLTTDRIVAKVKVRNTDSNSNNITFHTEGSTNYSVATTTLNQTVPTGAVTSVTGTSPIVSSGGTTPAISIPQATALANGYLSSADWSTFNGKQNPITLTTTGSSGAATLIGNTLNIPNYSFTDTNIYNSDGTLTGDRTLTYTGNRLLFTGTNSSTTLTLDMKASGGSGNRYIKLSNVVGTQTNQLSITSGGASLSYQNSSTLITTQVSSNPTESIVSYADASSTISNEVRVDSLVRLTYSDSIDVTQLIIGSNGYNFNGAYILPKVAGTNGQVLTTDGAGNVTWQTNGSGTVTSVGLSTGTTGTDVNVSGSPVTGSGSLNLNIPTASATNTGKLSNTDWSTFNNKQSALVSGTNIKTVNSTSLLGSGNVSVGTVTNVSALTLGTTGTDVSSTVATGTTTPVITLNIPTASATNRGALSSADWTTFNNKGNGTVTSVSALTLGTTGTDLSSSVATGTTTPVITLNVPTASATNRGALSSADWSTFNGKQAALVSGTNIKTVNSTSLLGSGDVSVGVTSVTGTAPISSSGGATPAISIATANATTTGALSFADWNLFNAKQTLLVSGVNIKTVNSTSLLGSGDLAVGTVTNVSALTIGTTGTDITSSVATGTTTPVITLNVPTASATNRGALSSTDWSTFNNKANTASPTFTGTPAAPTAASGTNTTQIATTAFVQNAISKQPEVIQVAASDETTNLTTGTAKVTFRMPYAMTLTSVRASLSTAQTAGVLLTIDVNQNGVSLFSTRPTFNNNEKTTTTAATPSVLSTTALTDDAEITVDIDQVGTAGAKGLKITLIGTRA
jgi:hypothetical protein